MSQYTIRGLEPEIEREIQRLANEQGKSLNQVLKGIIRKELQGEKPTPASSLRQLAGGWTREEAAAFNRSTDVFEQIDDEMWR